jgi:hypothetical protein
LQVLGHTGMKRPITKCITLTNNKPQPIIPNQMYV